MSTKAADRLAKLRERNKSKTKHVEPDFNPDDRSGFVSVRWYDKIRANPTVETVKDACRYYVDAVDDGKYYVVPVGNLETLLQQHPGITFFYQSILVDVQQSRRWLEERLDRLEAARHNYYMFDEEAKAEHGVLKTTEAAKMAKADPKVLEMVDMVRLLAFHEHQLEALMGAFDNIKYTLNHIVTIRKEKLEEVWVDPTKETTNA